MPDFGDSKSPAWERGYPNQATKISKPYLGHHFDPSFSFFLFGTMNWYVTVPFHSTKMCVAIRVSSLINYECNLTAPHACSGALKISARPRHIQASRRSWSFADARVALASAASCAGLAAAPLCALAAPLTGRRMALGGRAWEATNSCWPPHTALYVSTQFSSLCAPRFVCAAVRWPDRRDSSSQRHVTLAFAGSAGQLTCEAMLYMALTHRPRLECGLAWRWQVVHRSRTGLPLAVSQLWLKHIHYPPSVWCHGS